MAQTREKETWEKDMPTWNGSEDTWNGYLEDVEWYFYSLEPKHRGLLAHRLARKLTGTARNALKGLKANEFIGVEGIPKLLRILQSRVGDLPVPDLANKLDEFIFKLKRRPGESMNEWGLRSCETYRKLTIALDRVKGRPSDIGTFEDKVPTEKSEQTFPWPSEWDDENDWNDDHEDDDRSDTNSNYATGGANGTRRGKFGFRTQVNIPEHPPSKTPSEAPSKHSRKSKQSRVDDDGFQDEEGFLPTEVRGWLLLRNSGLTYTERATVIASTQGKLEFSTIFRALRQQYPPRDLSKIDESRSRGKRGGKGSIHAVAGLESESEDESGPDEGDLDENTSLMHVDVEGDEEFTELQAMEAEALQAVATGQKTLAHARKAIAQAKLSRGFHPRKPLPIGFKANKKFDRSSKPFSSSYSRQSHSSHSDSGCYICGGPHSFRNCPDKNAPRKSGAASSSNFVFMITGTEGDNKDAEPKVDAEKLKADVKVPLSDSEESDNDKMDEDRKDQSEGVPTVVITLNYGSTIPSHDIATPTTMTFREVLQVARKVRALDKIIIGVKLSQKLANLDQTLASVGIKTPRVNPYQLQLVLANRPEEEDKLKVFEELDRQGHLHSEPKFPPGLTFPDDGKDADCHALPIAEFRRQKAAKQQQEIGLSAKASGAPPAREVQIADPNPRQQPKAWSKQKWVGPIYARNRERGEDHQVEERGRPETSRGSRKDYNEEDEEEEEHREKKHRHSTSSKKEKSGKGDEEPRKRSSKSKADEKYEMHVFHANGRSNRLMMNFNEPVWQTIHEITTNYDYLNYDLRKPLTYNFNGQQIRSEEMQNSWNSLPRPNWKGSGDVLMITVDRTDDQAYMLDILSATPVDTPWHLALIDSGASETVASAEAIEALVNHLAKAMGRNPEVKVDPKRNQRFRVANGQVIQARSVVSVETPIGGLQIHCIVTEVPTPLLLSVSALRKLKSAIDFEKGVMAVNIKGVAKEIKLKQGDRGHLYLDFADKDLTAEG